MYFTKIKYNSIKTQKIHSLVYCSLASHLKQERPLFQINHLNNNLHIVSMYPPDINNMKMFMDIADVEISYYKDYLCSITEGSKFRFTIDALPTMKMVNENRRCFISNPRMQKIWFTKMANKYGFYFYSLSHSLVNRKGKYNISLRGVTFSGCLVVTDYIKFTRSLLKGIGHGKAWGFGLLQIECI